MGRFVCQCCGYLTLSRQGPGTNEVCGVCGWTDDLEQFQNPMVPNRANSFSLFQARNNFEATGVADENQRSNIRPAPQHTLSPGWFLLIAAGLSLPFAFLVLAYGGRLDTLFIGLPVAIGAFGWLANRSAARPRWGRCKFCGYDLTGLPGRRCPECGTGF